MGPIHWRLADLHAKATEEQDSKTTASSMADYERIFTSRHDLQNVNFERVIFYDASAHRVMCPSVHRHRP
jgi:hypothetical protein